MKNPAEETTCRDRTGEAESPSVSRAGLLKTGGAAVVGALVGAGVVAAPAQAAKQKKVTYDVAPDLTTFDKTLGIAKGNPFPKGPFYVEGPIYQKGKLGPFGAAPLGTPRLGTYRAWGWIFDGATGAGMVNESFELFGKGRIETQGQQGTSSRRALAGTGVFSKVRSNVTVAVLSLENLAFRVTFRYI